MRDVGNGAVGRPLRVSAEADGLGEVQHDGDRRPACRYRPTQQPLTSPGRHVGRVDNRRPAGTEALRELPMEHGEGCPADRLIRFAGADPPAERVGGQDLVWPEVARGKCRLAGTRHADQDNEGSVGDGDLHFVRLMIESAGSSARLPASAFGRAQLVTGLVVDRRAAG